MISLLRGRIVEKNLGRIVLDVHGVGYGITVPLSTYYRLPELGGEVELKIHTYVKDDTIELFGFLTEEEKKVFVLLLGVSGVGPRMATNILSSISPAEFISAVSTGELSRKKIPGIGSKLASRLVTELKDKFSKIQLSGDDRNKGGILEDIVSALINLGYKKSEIDEHIYQIEEAVAREKDMERALRESLKIMRRL
jgi:Holliday junction DNA helicase RuvA